MSKNVSFEVDIFDKTAIKNRLPELAKAIEAQRTELRELEDRYEQLRRWAGLRDGAGPKAREKTATPSIEDEVVQIVTKAGRPMTTMEVYVEIDRVTSTKTVNWALWKTARDGRLKKFGRGLYAPIDYARDQEGLLPNGDGPGVAGKEASAPVSGDVS